MGNGRAELPLRVFTWKTKKSSEKKTKSIGIYDFLWENWLVSVFNGSQLAKMKKSIRDMSMPLNL